MSRQLLLVVVLGALCALAPPAFGFQQREVVRLPDDIPLPGNAWLITRAAIVHETGDERKAVWFYGKAGTPERDEIPEEYRDSIAMVHGSNQPLNYDPESGRIYSYYPELKLVLATDADADADADAPSPGRHGALAAPPAVEVVGQGRGRGVAPSRVPAHGPLARRGERPRDAGDDACDPRGRAGRERPEGLDHVPGVRGPPGQDPVEDRPEGVDVGRGPDARRLELLRGHVGRRPEEGARLGETRPLEPVGQAEVEEPGPVRAGLDEDVGRLQVAVDEAGGVELVDGPGQLGEDVDRPLEGQLAPLQERLELGALDELHDADRPPQVALEGVDPHDGAPAAGLGRELRLAREAGQVDARGGVGVEELEGDGPLRGQVAGAEHRAHAAAAEEALDAVAAGDDGAGRGLGSGEGCHAGQCGRGGALGPAARLPGGNRRSTRSSAAATPGPGARSTTGCRPSSSVARARTSRPPA